MRIAIVNDLVLAVEILRRVVMSVPGNEIAWTAYDGEEAIARCAQDRPDLILMDLIMPAVDGVEATATIMRETPCPILVVTATVTGNAAKVFEAMGFGALDAVATPGMRPDGSIDGADALLRKIAVIAKLTGKETPATRRVEAVWRRPALVAIGSSTGGPKALATILSKLPGRAGLAVAIVQHVDRQFAAGLVDWLSEQTELKVALAREGGRPEADTVFLAGTNDHLVLGADGAFHYTSEPRDYPYRPSVDAFFQSLEQHWRQPAIAVLLTGMGRDGAKGLLALRQAGWHTLAQDEKTSVVYGMPKAAAELGAAVEILPLEEMAGAILRLVKSEKL